jgi:hypothetical protein
MYIELSSVDGSVVLQVSVTFTKWQSRRMQPAVSFRASVNIHLSDYMMTENLALYMQIR